MRTAAAETVSVYMVKELGRREVAEVNIPELVHSSSKNVLAMLGLMWRWTALQSDRSPWL